MSHSAFRILANEEPINRNLVIVVNKNGQVSTDTEALQNLLSEFHFLRVRINGSRWPWTDSLGFLHSPILIFAITLILASKEVPKTGISILRESSPTNSIADEIEQERQEKFEMKRQEFLSAHEGEEFDEEELENQMRQITGSLDDEIPHVTLSVEHFYTPDQAKKFATDVLRESGWILLLNNHMKTFFLF